MCALSGSRRPIRKSRRSCFVERGLEAKGVDKAKFDISNVTGKEVDTGGRRIAGEKMYR